MRSLRLLLPLLCLIPALQIQASGAPQATKPQKDAADQALLAANAANARSGYLERHLPFGVNRSAVGASHEVTLVAEDYVTRYDRDLYVPLWVAYRLQGDSLTLGPGMTSDRIEAFRPDPRLQADQAVTYDEYKNSSDFDRGHMAPNLDFIFGLNAMLNSYVMSNMCPQYGAFNSGIWLQLEKKVRKWAGARGTIYVTTGAIFDADGDGRRDAASVCARMGTRDRVAVPTHCYKIILAKDDGRWQALVVVLSNWQKRPANLSVAQAFAKGLRSVDQVEQVTGVNFFPGMPDDQERTLEAAVPAALWP